MNGVLLLLLSRWLLGAETGNIVLTVAAALEAARVLIRAGWPAQRSKITRQARARARAARARHLIKALRRRGPDVKWVREQLRVHERLQGRSQELTKLSKQPETELNQEDVEGFEEAVHDFLEDLYRLQLLQHGLKSAPRRDQAERMKAQVEAFEAQTPSGKESLGRASEDLSAALQVLEERPARVLELKARMVRLEVELEQIYLRIIKEPYRQGAGRAFADEIESLVEEDPIERKIEEELAALGFDQSLLGSDRTAPPSGPTKSQRWRFGQSKRRSPDPER